MEENRVIEAKEYDDFFEDIPVAVESKASDSKISDKGFIRKKPFIIILSVLLAIIIALSGAVLVMALKWNSNEKLHRAIYDKSQKITLAEGGEMISLYNMSMGDIQIPAIEGVPKSIYSNDNFVDAGDGFKYYYENSELCSYVGIDVSVHNGDIDWEKVAKSGVDFVMIRMGGRGYGIEGNIFADDNFEKNLKEAKKAGLWVGAYFFSQATNEKEAIEEAEFCIEMLKGEELDYPLAFDWEIVTAEGGTRCDNVDPRELTKAARAFCDKVKEEGYTPMLYSGSKVIYYKYNMAELSDIDVWYASYNDTPDLFYNYTMWQYSPSGRVEGVAGEVDLNICMKNYT